MKPEIDQCLGRNSSFLGELADFASKFFIHTEVAADKINFDICHVFKHFFVIGKTVRIPEFCGFFD